MTLPHPWFPALLPRGDCRAPFVANRVYDSSTVSVPHIDQPDILEGLFTNRFYIHEVLDAPHLTTSFCFVENGGLQCLKIFGDNHRKGYHVEDLAGCMYCGSASSCLSWPPSFFSSPATPTSIQPSS